MAKPNFFIIGAPKCGTTSLSEYLRTHPQIFMSTPKEPHYFSSDIHDRGGLSYESYLSLFAKADPKVHKAIGEGSTGYLVSERAITEILKFDPEARFIVMLRNPVEMVQSLHSERIVNGLEDILDFEEAWRAEKDRKVGKRVPFSCANPKHLFYSEWASYSVQIERLFAAVQKNRVHIILFDDFASDPKGVYEGVLKFLDVPADGRNEFPKIRESQKVRSVWLQQFLLSLGEFAAAFKKRTGMNWNLGLHRSLRRGNVSPGKRASISQDFRSELVEYFRMDVKKTSKLLGRDLTHWLSPQ